MFFVTIRGVGHEKWRIELVTSRSTLQVIRQLYILKKMNRILLMYIWINFLSIEKSVYKYLQSQSKCTLNARPRSFYHPSFIGCAICVCANCVFGVIAGEDAQEDADCSDVNKLLFSAVVQA